MKRLKLLLVLCTIWFGLSPAGVVSAEPVFRVGIVPQFEVRRLHSIWRPILDFVEAETGYRMRLIGSPTIPDFETEFLSGGFDFAYMNPYHVMLASDRAGYRPLVRDVGSTLFGILVVLKGGGIDTVADLDGRELAFPAPNALGASLQIRQELNDRFGIGFSPRYVKTHDSVYLNVVLGEVAAGGGVQKTLAKQKPGIRDRLKVIHSTIPVSPHPFAVHPRVPQAQAENVRQALIKLGQTAAGKAMLAKVPIQQIGTADMLDYEPLRGMDLERFYVEDN